MKKRLTRSNDKIIGGVCGGVGEYLNIDPTIVRALWLASVLLLGAGFLAYLLAWIIIPKAS